MIKIAVQTYQAPHGDAPQYSVPTAVHTDLRHPVSTKPAVFFNRRSTRSCCRIAYGRRAFLVAGARIWNDLPVDVTSAPSLIIFGKRLKGS